MADHILLDTYMAQGFTSIEGWVVPTVAQILKPISEVQLKHGIIGGVTEIGIHHGKFFLMLCQLLTDNELALAIDLFGRQDLNIDQSGSGNLNVFLSHVQAQWKYPQNIVVLEADSIALVADDLLSRIGRPRLFSIDGGHTVEHTVSDLSLASSVIVGGGVVILDDYYNQE
jgi:Methyltransferase domain